MENFSPRQETKETGNPGNRGKMQLATAVTPCGQNHLFITLQKYKKISRKPNAFPIIFKKSRVTLYPVPAVTPSYFFTVS